MPEAKQMWKEAERRVAKWLSEWWFGRKGVLRRSPMSGGWSHSKTMGDVIVDERQLRDGDPPFPFYVEVKRRKALMNPLSLWKPNAKTGIWALFFETHNHAVTLGKHHAILAVWVCCGRRGKILLFADDLCEKEFKEKFRNWLLLRAPNGDAVLTRLI